MSQTDSVISFLWVEMKDMKKYRTDRNLISFLLLSIITFGIYDIWFLHCLVKDVNDICAEYNRKSAGVLALILLGVITFGLYGVFWWYRLGDMLAYTARKRNVRVTVSGGTVLACGIASYFVCGLANLIALHSIFEATNDLAVDFNARIRTVKNIEEQRS